VIRIKDGVDLTAISPQMVLAHTIISAVFAKYRVDCVVTSCCDGQHKAITHYLGQALDYRTRNVPMGELTMLSKEIIECLGPQFDVVVEASPPHMHVEFDPRRDAG
jgi:hypothetical protein